MHVSEPGSVLLAAFPTQCTTQQEGNNKIYFLKILERETFFSSEGKVQHVFSTCSVSHRTSKDSSLLLWTVSSSFHCQCLPLAAWGLEPHLSWGTKCSSASSQWCLISSVQEKNRRYLSWSCLQPQKLSGVSHSSCTGRHTNMLSPPPASGGHKLISHGKGCALNVCQKMSIFCMSLLPFYLQHMEDCFTGQEVLCKNSYDCKPSLSLNAPSSCDHRYLRHVSGLGCFKFQWDAWRSL